MARSKVRHVAVMTKNREKMVEFYQKVFGLEPKRGFGGAIYMSDGDVNIAQLGDQLALKWSSFENVLGHWHYDTFRAEPGNRIGRDLVTFTLGGDGQVVKLQFLGQEFKKLKE